MTHSNKDYDLWVWSHGTLTEKDQQFGGWLRALATLPKKCLMVKVDGCEREEVRNERLPIVVSNNEVRVCNEANDHGLNRSDVVPIG